MSEAGTESPAPVMDLAGILADSESTSATLRIGVITEIETTVPYRVRLDIFADVWVNRDQNLPLKVDDRVFAVKQGTVVIVTGRLTGIAGGIPIGTVQMWGGLDSQVPEGWLLCDGSVRSRTTYADLFAAIGVVYGSTSSANFKLPNLVGRVPLGTSTTYPQADTGGTATIDLTTANMPAHTHGSAGDHGHGSVGDHGHGSEGSHAHSYPNAGGGTTAATGGVNVANQSAGTTGTSGSHSHNQAGGHSHGNAGGHQHNSVGEGTPVNSLPPYLSMLFIIRAL